MSNAVQPDKIILARESRGLTQTQLAKRMSISQGKLSKMESGVLGVSEAELKRLALVLNYPETFFFQTDAVLSCGPSELYHRKRQSTSAKLLRKVYADLNIHRMRLARLVRSVDIKCNIPKLNIEEYDGRAEEIAQSVRAQWLMPSGPVNNLTGVIEQAGGVVVRCDFQTRLIDGISHWAPGLPPMFLMNSTIERSRYRLTLAHELGHAVMHTVPNPHMEEEANRFAAEFLMPSKDIRSHLNSLTLPRAASLKPYWKVSMAALIMQARHLNKLSESDGTWLWIQMGKAGYRRAEPLEEEIPLEQPSLLRELATKYLNELGYNISELGKAIHTNPLELKHIYLDKGPLQVVNQ